jgi:hypothetical protein
MAKASSTSKRFKRGPRDEFDIFVTQVNVTPLIGRGRDMSKREGEVREVPFLGNDMKDQPPTTGRPSNQADAPGKADSECTQPADSGKLVGNRAVNVDDAQLDDEE